MTEHYNPDAYKFYRITEEEIKTWESGKWKGKRYTWAWLRETKLPEIRSRTVESEQSSIPMTRESLEAFKQLERQDEREKVLGELDGYACKMRERDLECRAVLWDDVELVFRKGEQP